MPISLSAKKALRISRRKTELNRARKKLIKETLKKASAKSLPQTISIIDKAVKWHIFHPNKAARLKSRLMGQLTDSKIKKSEKAADKSSNKPPIAEKAVAKKAALAQKTSAKKTGQAKSSKK